MLEAVNINVHLALFELDFSLNALDEMVVDGLGLHGGKGLWEIFSKVINKVK